MGNELSPMAIITLVVPGPKVARGFCSFSLYGAITGANTAMRIKADKSVRATAALGSRTNERAARHRRSTSPASFRPVVNRQHGIL